LLCCLVYVTHVIPVCFGVSTSCWRALPHFLQLLAFYFFSFGSRSSRRLDTHLYGTFLPYELWIARFPAWQPGFCRIFRFPLIFDWTSYNTYTTSWATTILRHKTFGHDSTASRATGQRIYVLATILRPAINTRQRQYGDPHDGATTIRPLGNVNCVRDNIGAKAISPHYHWVIPTFTMSAHK